MNWEITFYDESVKRDIAGLPPGMRARFVHLVDRIEQFGPNLGMPHSRAIGEGLFELRMKSKEGIGRAFFCTIIQKRVVILHVFIKKTQKTPQRELQKAIQRMKEIKS